MSTGTIVLVLCGTLILCTLVMAFRRGKAAAIRLGEIELACNQVLDLTADVRSEAQSNVAVNVVNAQQTAPPLDGVTSDVEWLDYLRSALRTDSDQLRLDGVGGARGGLPAGDDRGDLAHEAMTIPGQQEMPPELLPSPGPVRPAPPEEPKQIADLDEIRSWVARENQPPTIDMWEAYVAERDLEAS